MDVVVGGVVVVVEWGGFAVDVVDVVETGPFEMVVGVVGGTVTVLVDVVGVPKGTAVAVVVVVATKGAPVSGLTHPAGGVVEPCWPGMRTVPAQPRSDRVSPIDVEPSENLAVEAVWRM